MKKITIQKLIKKRFDVKNPKPGQSKQGVRYGIAFNGTWYSAFEADWNRHWKEGDEIEVEVKETQVNGQTYYNIQAPQSAKGGGVDPAVLQKIVSELAEIKAMVTELYKGSEPPAADEDFPF